MNDNAIAEPRSGATPLSPVFEHLQRTPLRRPLLQAFSSSAAEAMRPQVQALATPLLERMLPRGEAELVRDYAFPLTVLVLAQYTGLPREAHARLRGWCAALDARAGSGAPAEPGAVLQDMGSTLSQLLGEGRLQGMPRGTPVRGEALAALMQLLIVGVHESALHLLGHAVFALLRQPTQRGWLMRDPEGRAPVALQELLGEEPGYRLGSPLARVQAEVALGALLRHAPDLQLGMPAESVAWRMGTWGRRPAGLPLKFMARCACAS